MPETRRLVVRTTSAVVAVVVAAVAALVVLRLAGHGDDPPTPHPTGPTVTANPSTLGVPVFGPPPVAAADLPPDTSLGAVTRSRYVTFDGSALPTTSDGTLLALDFFDDASFVGRVDHVDRQTLFTSWSGPLVGLPESVFVITQTGDRYQVTASTTQGSFTMSLTASGFYQAAQAQQPTVLDSGGASVPTSATP